MQGFPAFMFLINARICYCTILVLIIRYAALLVLSENGHQCPKSHTVNYEKLRIHAF